MTTYARQLLEIRQRYGWRVNAGRIARMRMYEVNQRHAVADSDLVTMEQERAERMLRHYRELRQVANKLVRVANQVLNDASVSLLMLFRLPTMPDLGTGEVPREMDPVAWPLLDLHTHSLISAPRPGPLTSVRASVSHLVAA